MIIRKPLSALCLVLATALCLGTAAVAQTLHPDLTRQRFEATKISPPDKDGGLGTAAVSSDRYDVLEYHLSLRLDPAAKAVDGSVVMAFASRYEGLRDVVFDLTDSLVVSGITHRSGDLGFVHRGDTVTVTLPAALAVGEVDSVVIHYAGTRVEPTYNRGLLFRAYVQDGHRGQSIANLSEPAYGHYWWPCKDRPDDKATSRVSLTVPDTLTAVSNGHYLRTDPADPGWRTFHWYNDYPIATYLISVAVADYVVLTDHCYTDLGSDIPIFNWVFPPDAENAAVDFAPLCDMMEFCEGHFGQYPFQGQKYGHAEFLWNGAMEHQSVTSIGYGSINGDGSRDWLIIHELGHQWFGDSLTPHTWADIWLNEGFATYSEALWYENLDGPQAYQQYLNNSRTEGAWVSQGPVYDPVPVFPGRVIYDKGAWILHMLRRRMGDGPFFSLVEDWAQGGGRPLTTVQTQPFIDLASAWAGEPLDDFLWPYLESTALPRLALSYEVSDGVNGPGTHLEVDLRQIQTPLFDNVYPLQINTTTGPVTDSIALSTPATRAAFDLPDSVTSIVLDPAPAVLWTLESAVSVPRGLITAYPNPSPGGYIVFRYKLEDPARVTLTIHDAYGHRVDRLDLGTVEPEAGFNEIGWDVTDDKGGRVPSGVYWGLMEIAGQRSVQKFSVIR